MRSNVGFVAFLFWIMAGVLFWAAASTGITVPSEGYPGGVANLSLMHQQALFGQMAGFASVIAAIFTATALLLPAADREAERARKGLPSSKQICPVCDEAVSAQASVCKWCDADLVDRNAEEDD